MKESLWGYWLVLMGIIVITLMILLHNYTTTNQQDYYLAREITYASMYDSIDYGYFKKHGELKIIKEKFVENFIRRFAENATLNKTYKVNFYDIYETPPVVSLEIRTTSGDIVVANTNAELDVTTRVTAILEAKGKTSILKTRVYTSFHQNRTEFTASVSHGVLLPTKSQLALAGYSGEVSDYDISIKSINYVKNMNSDSDLQTYEDNYYATFGIVPPNNSCYYDITGCRVRHYGTLENVNIESTGMAVDKANITWTADVKSQCSTSIGELPAFSGQDKCAYGIVYDIVWEVVPK